MSYFLFLLLYWVTGSLFRHPLCRQFYLLLFFLFSLLLRANIKNFLAWPSWNEVECRENAEGKGGRMGQLISILWFSVSPSRPLLSWLGWMEGGLVWVVSWDVFAASDFGPKARRSRIPMWVIESQAEMHFISNLLIKVSCRAIYVSFKISGILYFANFLVFCVFSLFHFAFNLFLFHVLVIAFLRGVLA